MRNIIEKTKINNKTNNLEFTLEGYQRDDNFPRKLILKVETEETFEATINYSKVEINTPQKFLFKIPVSYEISGNYLGYLKFRRLLAKSNKVINFDKEEIKVVKGGGINSIGTLSIVGLPDEYK